MYCTDKQFIDIALATGVDAKDLHELLSTIVGLHQHWGALLKSDTFHEAIQKDFPEVVKMIQLLLSLDKIEAGTLKSLCTYAAGGDEEYTFSVVGTAHQEITKKLQTQFGEHEIAYTASNEPALHIAGHGRWYKRGLHQDLEKILH